MMAELRQGSHWLGISLDACLMWWAGLHRAAISHQGWCAGLQGVGICGDVQCPTTCCGRLCMLCPCACCAPDCAGPAHHAVRAAFGRAVQTVTAESADVSVQGCRRDPSRHRSPSSTLELLREGVGRDLDLG